MILEETYTLSNGVKIPKLGLGTWFISNQDVVQAMKDSLRRVGDRELLALGEVQTSEDPGTDRVHCDQDSGDDEDEDGRVDSVLHFGHQLHLLLAMV